MKMKHNDPDLWDTTEAFLRRKLIMIQACLRKQEKNFRQPNLTPKGPRKRKINKSQTQKKERNHKDQNRNK